VRARDAIEAGARAGFTASQVQVAKERLGARSQRIGHQWMWLRAE
jgi:hypothetical protein